MQIQLDWISFFFATAIIIGVYSALILLLNRNNQKANRFLALLLIFISLWLVDAFFNASEIYLQNPDFYFKPIYYSFAFGPLIYFYVKSLISNSFEFRKQDWLHFIPVFIQAGLYWILNFQSYAYKRTFWFDIHQPITYRIEFDGTLISLMVYLYLSIRLTSKYQSWVKEHFSEISKVNLNWLKLVLSVLILWSTQWLFELILREFFDQFYYYNFTMLILAFLIIILGIGGILQENISRLGFVPVAENAEADKPEVDPEILSKIIEAMQKGQYFLNPTLSLKEFAEAINIPKRVVSEHLNHGQQKSFIDFVNHYRVEEVKRRLASDDAELYNLLGIAKESGFRSKATFYRVFKQLTGQSPSDFTRS